MHVATPDFYLTTHERLRGAGISAVLHWDPKRCVPRISFLITAAHNLDEVDRAADAVREIVARVKSTIRKERDHVRYLHI
jgi:hypothetical protein